jgi:hypothetical protein
MGVMCVSAGLIIDTIHNPWGLWVRPIIVLYHDATSPFAHAVPLGLDFAAGIVPSVAAVMLGDTDVREMLPGGRDFIFALVIFPVILVFGDLMNIVSGETTRTLAGTMFDSAGDALIVLTMLVPLCVTGIRRLLFRRLFARTRFAPAIHFALVLLCATILFVVLSDLMVRQHLAIILTDAGSLPQDRDYFAFYFYQLATSLPVIDLANSYQWHPPLTHSGVAAGSLILTYKLLVLTPLIAYAANYLNDKEGGPVL